jgi:hypothetical protein
MVQYFGETLSKYSEESSKSGKDNCSIITYYLHIHLTYLASLLLPKYRTLLYQ